METPIIVKNDSWLKPFEQAFIDWNRLSDQKETELCQGKSLQNFATGHLFFGLHNNSSNWVIREWVPNATALYLMGDFSNWQAKEPFKFKSEGHGIWTIEIEKTILKHQDLYALWVNWNGGSGKRIPAWATRVVQDPETYIFNAQVWAPEKPYQWKITNFEPANEPPLIYEAHVGMAGEEERVHTFQEFRTQILPRIVEAGYNTIQFMAMPEHPYYGSFGYHVSSFFAASSRFGTPDDLKQLIDDCHKAGIAVIMDLIHSHAVKNAVEGLGEFDGTRWQFFHDGPRGEHPAWDSYCFNYGKNEVLHFLLSNIQYWLTEYKFDGYRFDGVTSMLYLDHGLGKAFSNYNDYFTPNLDYDAIVYFKLANKLIHEINPKALSIAEEVSGLPGLAAPLSWGGLGFDFRMAMGIPDYWIKMIKEKKDEDWEVGDIFHQLTAHRMDEKVVSYAESHDQALVGDKTIIFRLIDKEMYYSMRKDQPNLTVERGIALHKIIRLITLTCAGGAYLNFMGNEFGHPEWIDFPREGNNWSYKHARRLWSISDNYDLRFHWLKDFDRELIHLVRSHKLLEYPEVWKKWESKSDQVLVYSRGDLLFVFNFSASQSYSDYGIALEPSKYKVVLNTDSGGFGGYSRIDEKMTYYTIPDSSLDSQHYLRLYLPARTAFVLQRAEYNRIR
jgi:1,4-alpha-glucan branching enzyme